MPEGASFFLEAYRDLVSCRRYLEGAIPWDAVALYAERLGLEWDTFNLLWSVVSKMDHVDRQWTAEQVKTNAPPPQKAPAADA